MVWDFIQKELLGMGWLNRLVGAFLSEIFIDALKIFVFDGHSLPNSFVWEWAAWIRPSWI